jgi:hypothetical protein
MTDTDRLTQAETQYVQASIEGMGGHDARAQAERDYVAAATQGMEREDNRAYQPGDALGAVLLAEFGQAENARRDTEERWLKDLRQYRGIYDPDVLALIGPRRSRAFVRATRVKIKTVDARVADLLFPTGAERTWLAEATSKPSIDRATKAQIVQALQQAEGRAPSKQEVDAAIKKVVTVAAKGMMQVIDDQLAEADYATTARQVLHSGHLYGTGVLKAPLVERKTRSKFVIEQGKWAMKVESYVVPFLDYVPLWRWYPDMSATSLAECRYAYERHLMTRAKLASLAKKKSFKGKAIRDYIEANPKGAQTARYFDTEIRAIGERPGAQTKDDGNYEVLERWGWLDGELLAGAGWEVPGNRMHETFFGNVWMLPDGTVIKVVLQPINGVTWPYHLYYVDKDETSIFGDGYASVMRDDQTMINAGTRMVLDNGALTAGPQFEVNMDLLSPQERADDMYPFKIWARNGKDPAAPAVRVLQVPNGLEYLMPVVEMFKKNADDVTAIPRYMQGENATQGAAGTASGMSMLMANASIGIKDLLRNYDSVTQSFIESLYKWNMQFNPDDSIKGDFNVKARGTASLMAKELRGQQLNDFAATIAPEDAPYIKREELLRQRAAAHDLDSIVKTEEEVAAEQNNQQAQQAAAMGQQLQALQLENAQLAVKKTQAEVAKLAADVERIHAIAVKTNVDGAYAAMQAGGVAASSPQVAPAGDAILLSAGYIDKTPKDAPPTGPDPTGVPVPAQAGMPAAPQGENRTSAPAMPDPSAAASPPPPDSASAGPGVGEGAGIETARLDG